MTPHHYAQLKDHFGHTVVAMFTDEPMLLGRDAKRGPDPWPFTNGFLEDLQAHWDTDVRRWLPALWLDCGPRTADFRQAYTRAVYERLERVFYGAQSRWCHEHGIALTGHPAESNEFGSLCRFQWPGQDMVWRWVTPGGESALVGPHSCAPKCASSAAAVQGSRRNATEALGAYGWQLTLDEAKEYWDPLDGTVRPWPGVTIDGRTHTHLRLERRQGLILAVEPQGEAQPEVAMPPLPGAALIDIAGPWQTCDDEGNRLDLPCPADWAQLPGWETYAGRLRFRTSFTLTPAQVQHPLFLDLGQVGDIADVVLNGTPVGVRAWAPYVWTIDQICQAGDNQLEVRVTNSMANRFEGLQRPSGLLGPVSLRGPSW